jgi:hypothetical protein
MDRLLDAILYRHTLDELRKQKEILPEEYQVGYTVFEQALMDAIRYQKNKLGIEILTKKLYEESKYVIIKGERYYSIDTINNILKELEGGEDE